MADSLLGELKRVREEWAEAAREADEILDKELDTHPSAVALSVRAQAYQAKVELRRAAYEDLKERAYEAARNGDQRSARCLAIIVAIFTFFVAIGTMGRLAVALHLIGG